MARSAYIHIPFCSHKCDFCDFVAFAGVDELKEEYCLTVAREIEERQKQNFNEDKLDTVFFGGGTPGYVEPNDLALILNSLHRNCGITDGAEITLETTPHTINATKCKDWLELGINRISIGLESLDDAELKAMGRDHTREQALEGVKTARESGYDNIALDLMYGLPEQTIESWSHTLSDVLNLRPKHISAYGLTLAEHSPLFKRYPRYSEKYPNEELFAQMYQLLVEKCEQEGLKQYEIANFAIPGFESRHNLSYWHNCEYLAFGVGAHRYYRGKRSSNFRSLKRYMREYTFDESEETIDSATRLQESIFLGLRLREGLDLDSLREKYGCDLIACKQDKIRELENDGFLELDSGKLRLSQKGILVSNSILAELI